MGPTKRNKNIDFAGFDPLKFDRRRTKLIREHFDKLEKESDIHENRPNNRPFRSDELFDINDDLGPVNVDIRGKTYGETMKMKQNRLNEKLDQLIETLVRCKTVGDRKCHKCSLLRQFICLSCKYYSVFRKEHALHHFDTFQCSSILNNSNLNHVNIKDNDPTEFEVDQDDYNGDDDEDNEGEAE